MQEIEQKYLLTKSQYEKISNKTEWDDAINIFNYYYDTSDFKFYEMDITVRVRKINKLIQLEIKMPVEKQINLNISEERKIKMNNIPESLSPEIIEYLTGYAVNNVKCIGLLVTERKIKKHPEMIIALDCCRYLGKVDYELEIEYSKKDDMYLTKSLIEYYELNDTVISEGKRARFIRALKLETNKIAKK
jgi:uncharacterized protein YjbK